MAFKSIKEIPEVQAPKWTIVREGNTGESFWNDKDQDFTIDFANKGNASYIFNTADEARAFINEKWPWETRKKLPYILQPYTNEKITIDGVEIKEPEYRLK